MSSDTDKPEMPESPLDKDVDDMRRWELRGKIAVLVGCNTNWRTPLSKSTLNSVYAYMTGEFHVQPARIHHQDATPRSEILLSVVYAAGIGDPDDRWTPTNGETPRELRRDELQKLYEVMSDRGDQRSWTPGGDDGK